MYSKKLIVIAFSLLMLASCGSEGVSVDAGEGNVTLPPSTSTAVAAPTVASTKLVFLDGTTKVDASLTPSRPIPLSAAVEVVFSKDMNDRSFVDGVARLVYVAEGTEKTVAGAATWSDKRTLVFTPQYHRLKAGTACTFEITTAAESEDEAKLATAFSQQFKTMTAGDVDGDEHADVVVGAPNVGGSAGRAYVYSGKDLTGTFVAALAGSNNNELVGYSAAVGDVNGDGYADVVIGAPGVGGKGAVYIINGATGAADWTLTGEAAGGHQFGYSVAVGDVDGDGKEDVIVGDNIFDDGALTGAGKVYVYSGESLSGAAIAAITGVAAGDKTGSSVAAGDMDGDGHYEVAAGAPLLNSQAGAVYVFSGVKLDSNLYTSDAAGAVGWTLAGPAANTRFGWALSMGDMDGDGKADLAVGAPRWNSYLGKVYIYNDSGLNSGTTIATVTGTQAAGKFGSSVAAVADADDDGRSELVVGAPGADKAYFMYGKLLTADIDASQIAGSIGTGWVVAGGGSDSCGSAVSGGDVTADGTVEFIVGCPAYNAMGETVIYSIADGYDINNGSLVNPAGANDMFGTSVSGGN
ncbi:MAG: FG-GAP-like repeat-containing protein [Pseudomonadota bacterium]